MGDKDYSERTRVQIGGPMPQAAATVQDVSLRGLELVLTFPVAAGQDLPIEVDHPILSEPLRVEARALWCRMIPGGNQPIAGLEWLDTSPDQRKNLRRLQAAELSCRIVCGERTAGFLLSQTEDTWAVYDEDTVKVAGLVRRGEDFTVHLFGTRPEDSIQTIDAGDVQDAIALILHLEAPPLVVPPEGGQWKPVGPRTVPAAQPSAHPAVGAAQPMSSPASSATEAPEGATGSPGDTIHTRAFHKVMAGGYHVGFAAVTSVDDAWSVFDDAWTEIAIVQSEGERFKVLLMSSTNESLDYMAAKTFLGGVALALGLKVNPEFDPPLPPGLRPSDSALLLDMAGGETMSVAAGGMFDDEGEGEGEGDDEGEGVEDEEAPLRQDRPHHSIYDDERLVGYAAPARGLPGFWSVYDEDQEKIAMVAPEAGRYKILFLGHNPDDSLEYMMARSFEGAVGLIFELDALPVLDPPVSSA